MNNTQINWQLNWWNPLLALGSSFDYSFDGYDINSKCTQASKIWISLQRMNWLDLDNISVEAFNSSLSDFGGVIDKRYENKTITLEFFIQGDNHNDLVARIQELKKRTQGIEKDFVCKIGGIRRTYKATVTRVTVPRFSRLDDFVEGITVDMLISSEWEWSAVSRLVSSVSADREVIHSNDGDTKMFPRIIFLFKSGTTASKIDIGTRGILETETFNVSLTTAITAGDIVEFNYKEKFVKKWNTEMPFSGVFMPLDIGLNVFEFDFTWTVNCDIYLIYNPVYL